MKKDVVLTIKRSHKYTKTVPGRVSFTDRKKMGEGGFPLKSQRNRLLQARGAPDDKKSCIQKMVGVSLTKRKERI